MSVTFQVDLREFNRAIKEHAKVDTKRSMAQIVNQSAYSVGVDAYKLTHKANILKIREIFNHTAKVVSQNIRILKSGGIKRGKVNVKLSFGSKAYAFTQVILKRKKGHTLSGPELEAAVKKEYARRVGAITYLKSGWIAAIKVFAYKIGKSPRNSGKKVHDYMGGGSVATESTPRAAIWNTAFNRDNMSNNEALEHAQQSVTQAISRQITHMERWAARKLQRQADKWTARMLR